MAEPSIVMVKSDKSGSPLGRFDAVPTSCTGDWQTCQVALDLNPGEWAVLGVIAQEPAHGFAVAQLLAPDGSIGRVWAVPRPLVYQHIKKLTELGLVAPRRAEPGRRGPQRTPLGATPAGRRAVKRWLEQPVEHVRDVRSLLLLKLALLDRAHQQAGPLVAAQRTRVQAQVDALNISKKSADGFDRVLLEWRMAGTRSTLDFLDAVQKLTPATR
jgi:DNA-binding PadR family transcriptional regulator